MTDWFQQHAVLIQTATGFGTALIWLVYLQMLLSGLLRQRRASLSINRGAGEGMESHIILSNLGYEPIYVQDVLATLVTTDGVSTAYVTDRKEMATSEVGAELAGTTQGPLKMGEFIALGTIKGILSRAAPELDAGNLPQIEKITFTVLGTSQKPGGGRKSYRVTTDDASIRHLEPERLDTERLSARQCRRIVRDQGADV